LIKNILSIFLCSFLLVCSNFARAAEDSLILKSISGNVDHLGNQTSNGQGGFIPFYGLYKRDTTAGTETALTSFSAAGPGSAYFDNNGWTSYSSTGAPLYLSNFQASKSSVDNLNSKIYLYDDTEDTFVVYDYKNNTSTQVSAGGDVQGQFNVPSLGSVLEVDSNTVNIKDTSGTSMIRKTSDGATHIGENSLVTQEVGGVQQLYATDANGNQIDINIKRGTNLLIDGTNIMTHISNSTALSSALSSLPTSATGDALYNCGIGYGHSAGSSALSGGCAMELKNFKFTNEWNPFFKSATFNVGGSSIINGVDETSVKMGLTFALGSVPSEENLSTASLSESNIDFKLLESKSKQQQAKIQKLEQKLYKLSEELKIARNEITSNKLVNLRLERLEKQLNQQLAALN